MSTSRTAPAIDGVHHLKFPVTDLTASLRWWEGVFGAERQADWDHRTQDGHLFAYMLLVPGLEAPLELRLDPEAARSMAGFDPVTFAVHTEEDLHEWAGHLDALAIEHSPVLRGVIGWVLVMSDPDGTRVRLYARESHEWDVANSDMDSPWIAPSGRPGA